MQESGQPPAEIVSELGTFRTSPLPLVSRTKFCCRNWELKETTTAAEKSIPGTQVFGSLTQPRSRKLLPKWKLRFAFSFCPFADVALCVQLPVSLSVPMAYRYYLD
jgi:hypothetical protein